MERMSAKFGLTWLFLVSLVMTSEAKQCNQTKPNIIIMLMDDMGWGDLGVNGDPTRETVHLDQMASEGMVLTDFYAGNPLCSPSRAALLTGRLPIRNGFYTNNIKARNGYVPQEIVGGIQRSEVLISELLNKVGYKNKIVGKWHLGHSKPDYFPLNRGFHEFYGSPGVHFGPWDNKENPNVPVFRNEKMIGRYYENVRIDPKTHMSDQTQNFTEEAIHFIEKNAKANHPFFLYWTPDTLHAPTYRSEAYVGRSVKNSSYGDALVEIDDSIGRIMDLIRNDQCLHNNTFVFFTSDNGPALVSKTDAGSNGPLLCGKQTTFEGGFREPAIAWWPGKIKSGSISHSTGTVMDLFRTAANLAGASVPTDRVYDSFDLAPMLFEGKQSNTSIFYYRGDTLMALRHGSYKAHFYTFSTPTYEVVTGIDYCPGQRVANLTTEVLTSHLSQPALFHLPRDPGERYPIPPNSAEYKRALEMIERVYLDHVNNLKPGEPQLNMCDNAVKLWSPAGCKELNMCHPVPKSAPYVCDWPH